MTEVIRKLALAGFVFAGLSSAAHAGFAADAWNAFIDTTPAGYARPAAERPGEWQPFWEDTLEGSKRILEEGRNLLVIPTYTNHPRWAWDNRDEQNAYPFGMGLARQVIDERGNERLFFIEVMGRDAGFLALNGAIATGSEAAIIPEISTEVDQLEELIKNGFRKSKNSSIVLVAESPITGGAMHLAERVQKEYPQYDVRVTILGHIQRGGSPTAHDRILASRMGAAAIDALLEDQRNVMIGIRNNEIEYVPFNKAIKNDKPIDRELLNTLRKLSI